MDELEKRLTFQVTKNDKTYTFRRPTVRQLIAADVLAAQLRGLVPVHALLYSVGLSDMVAALNTYVIEPKNFDFTELHEDEMGEIYNEVAKWLDTFRKPVAGQ